MPSIKNGICVVIVSYNGSPWIAKCIESVLNTQGVEKVFVVDNGSSDNTVEIVQRYPVEVINVGINLGFGKGNNVAIAKALEEGFSYILLLNQDVYMEPDSLTRLVDAHAASGHKLCILCPIQMNGTFSDVDHNFGKYLSKQIGLDTVKDFQSVEYPGPLLPGHFFNAAAWLIPVSVIRKVGVFDPIFFHYREDEDYATRCAFWSVPFFVNPVSRVAHDRDQSGFVELACRPFDSQVSRVNVRILKEMKDIRKPLLLCIIKSHFFVFRRVLFSIKTVDFSHFRAVVLGYFHALKLFPSVIKNRKISTYEGAFISEAVDLYRKVADTGEP